MLDLETTPLGFSGLLWRRFEAGGRALWLSLALRRMSAVAPPWAPGGGLLGECQCVFVRVVGLSLAGVYWLSLPLCPLLWVLTIFDNTLRSSQYLTIILPTLP